VFRSETSVAEGAMSLDEKGEIRIADFGNAKCEDCGTTTTDVAGTLGYVASQALEGDEVTKKSDVFAFGLIMYEVLVGVFPKIWDCIAWDSTRHSTGTHALIANVAHEVLLKESGSSSHL
jgi:serine/threonine protein kinase